MECEDPNREHQSETERAPARHDIEGDAYAGGDECGAEKSDPENVPGYPRGYQRANGRESEKMIYSEYD